MIANPATPAVTSRAALPPVRRALDWRTATGLWVFLLALVHGALYAVLTPPWQAPDETAHFEYAWLLGELRRPLWWENASPELERAIIQTLDQFHAWEYVGLPADTALPERLADVPFYGRSRTLTRFSLSYVPYALAALPLSGAGVIAQLYAMRAVSVVCGALVVMLTYQMARLVEPKAAALAWGSALFVLFLPQHAAINSAVSDGVPAELLCTLTIYGLVGVWRRGLNWRRAGLIAVSAVAALLSKSTALFLIPLLALSAVWGLRQWYEAPERTQRQRQWAAAGALVSLVVVGGGGVLLLPWLNRISSQVANVSATLAESFGSPQRWAAYLQSLVAGGTFTNAVGQTYESFWAFFGWMVVRVPAPWITLISILPALAVLGWGYRWATDRRARSPLYLPLGLAAALAAGVLLAWFVLTPVGPEYSQGRYLFGAMAPLAVLLTAGWLSWRPARFHPMLLLALVAAWVTFDAAALFGVLVPYFYRVG